MAKTKITVSVIEVPIFETQKYVSRHIDVHLPVHHATVMRNIMDGLIRAGAQTKNGRVVDSPASTLIWMLENLQSVDSSNYNSAQKTLL